MADKKEKFHRKKKKKAEPFRNIIQKVSVSESDLRILKDKVEQARMRMATYCYRVLMGKQANFINAEHKKARIAVATIISNFTQICNHSNVGEFLAVEEIDFLRKISVALGEIIKIDVFARYENKEKFSKPEDSIEDGEKWSLMRIKKRDPNNKRLKRLEISISQEDKELLVARAANLGLRLSQYIYYRVMHRRLKFAKHIETEILQRIAGYSATINEISHRYNIYETLADEDVNALMNAAKKIIYT